MDSDFIFVYGLLKSNFENEAAAVLQANCKLIGEGYISGYLYDLGDYPGAIYDETSPHMVYVEVFKILQNKEKMMQFLDEFEGVGPQYDQPNEYKREILTVCTSVGELCAFCYVFNRNPGGFKLLEGGRYQNL